MSTRKILVLNMIMREIEPKVTRTLAIDARASLSTLHRAMQILFGWYNYHLHEFVVGEDVYAADDGFGWMDQPPKSTSKRLSSLLKEEGDSLLYRYDFGDDWEVDVRLASLTRVAEATPKAFCLAASRSGPLEDSGGPWGYMETLRILGDPRHEEYLSTRRWVPKGFKSESVDLGEINQKLLRL